MSSSTVTWQRTLHIVSLVLLCGLGHTTTTSAFIVPARRLPSRQRLSAFPSSSSNPSPAGLDGLLPPLPAEQLVEYLRNGHTCVRGLFSQEEVTGIKPTVMAAFEAELVEALRHEV